MTETSFNIAAATREELGQQVLSEVSRGVPDVQMLGKYIAAGADLEQKNADGLTPLLVSLIRNDTDVALTLIRGGAKLDVTDGGGDTPLMHAVNRLNYEVIRELRSRNAPRRPMSGMSSEKWDDYIDGLDAQIAKMGDDIRKPIPILKSLALNKEANPAPPLRLTFKPKPGATVQ